MNFLTRFGDRHDRKEKKMAPDRSQSVDPNTMTSAPLSPRDSHPSSGRPRRSGPLDNPCSPAGIPPTDANWVMAEEDEEELDDCSTDASSSHLHGKRRTVSISRSGRYKDKIKERPRMLSDDVYRGTGSSPSPTTPTMPSLSLAKSPVPSLQQHPQLLPKTKQKKKDLVKPSSRDKSPARPYIILKSDSSSVNFAIESTTL